ncbi:MULTISPECIES: DegT/DnrJ/EryC1/StrS family aminotransferase [Virgibacillus]|uniref:UDP-4-amino-4-deoxy-L-arabinose--oxoglutarate aminotransferase n=1 Tax=Virgibacillus dokdonensis TaxID=302167 RepID=A0A2K9IYT2_9BACI|nr:MULTISPECIES: DegT/DnrJ/EryC1/StrS family aminotransferase [Virgibacillus]AUJ24837.1 UDP-4-amino-4-deoxy-L-arabinose--oxoglutarate aminotransferase [Virgibacillus dokdonensis]NWO14497.1 DegT/DnrJ/EryC1/StrS family aminotransferase [Virgibacillus sp.]
MIITNDFIPFHRAEITSQEINNVIDALKSGWISKGPKVVEFEEKLASFLNTKHVITCNSGTAALHMALLSMRIGPGDEVIVPSFTFCSSVNVILHVGATPVFVDINEDNFCLNISDVKSKISAKTKAIIAVHFAGYPADLKELSCLARDNELYLIEDAAHAFTTKFNNQYIGTHGDAICFSFYATKNITTGEGGALVVSNDTLAEKARLYGWHGISKNAWNRYTSEGSWKYDVMLPGFKYNMTDIQAAIGSSQLEKAEMMRNKKEKIASYYSENLNEISEFIKVPFYKKEVGLQHGWHLFVIRVKNNNFINRDEFIERMKERKIGLSVHFIPVHLHPYYQTNFPTSLPVTENIYDEIVSLPLYSNLTKEETSYIVKSIKEIFMGASR